MYTLKQKIPMNKMTEIKNICYVNLKPAQCPLDLGDGSERAEYVDQDYILNALGRPHRCVNLMYTYYPNDKEWPKRISEACRDMEVSYAWDYPYDDYFPYGANGEPFNQIRDIRKHGQDVMLTITMDTKVSDEELRQIGRDLKPFGRLRLRINHECDGTWFTHNKRNTYEEIGAFFTRASKLIKSEAPNISTVFCAGMIEDDKTDVPYKEEFDSAYRECDIYSCDRYMALNYGWPYDVANPGGGRYYALPFDKVYKTFTDTKQYLTEHFGDKPMILGEFNTDGDVTGGFMQPDSIVRFYERLVRENATHLAGISMYQFRDRGRLGLEMEDPNNSSNGIRQPLFSAYRKIIHKPYFMPRIDADEGTFFPATLRWGGSEDATGIKLSVKMDSEKMPVFFEITCDEENSLMIEVLGRWFYKGVGVKTIDLMPVFYEAEMTPGIIENAWEDDKTVRETNKKTDSGIYNGLCDTGLNNILARIRSQSGNVQINIFATPRDGSNPETGADDWYLNYYDTIKNEPQIRLLYEPCDVVR